MFNTLKYAKILEDVGFSREQAETSIKVLLEVMEDKLATQDDINDIRDAIKDIRDDIKELRFEIQQMESRLLIKMGAMSVAWVAVVVALIKLT